MSPDATGRNQPDGRTNRDGAITARREARAARVALTAEPRRERVPNDPLDKVPT
jgi:hypothetical protein